MRVASCTLVTRSCLAEPLVEKESMATRGLDARQRAGAVRRAQSDAGQLLGVGVDVHGAVGKDHHAIVAIGLFGHSIRKQEDTVLDAGLDLMICKAGRSMSPVEWMAPETRPSASPIFTIITP